MTLQKGKTFRTALLLVLTSGVVAAVALGANWSRTRPGRTCGIPAQRYPHGDVSQPILAGSSPVIVLAEPVQLSSPLAQPRPDNTSTKLFQWPEAKYAVGHCSISRPVLQVHGDGTWTLNLRADQNPRPADSVAPAFNPTEFIKRNQFRVQLRCYDTQGASDAAAFSGVGQPCVAEILPEAFWVERGQPYLLRVSGRWNCKCTSDVEAFERMDRAELEFTFR